MNKEIFIRDYLGNKVKITIENFEKVKEINVMILSGDETLEVEYIDGDIKCFDSSSFRITDYYDGEYELSLDKVDAFSNFNGSSYACRRMFR